MVIKEMKMIPDEVGGIGIVLLGLRIGVEVCDYHLICVDFPYRHMFLFQRAICNLFAFVSAHYEILRSIYNVSNLAADYLLLFELFTIMASLAQQESESLSENVKMGLQFRYQNGEAQINHNWFLGYTKDENGHLVIDEEQAVVVRRIFREYLQGASLKNIADGLMADGIPTATRNMKWRSDGIRKILTNEKYMGDALLQKTYTVDVLTKKRVANNGIVPQYYVENNHEAIIPRQLFMQVQEELQRRTHLRTENVKTKRVYSSKYALSSIIYCGKCGDLFTMQGVLLFMENLH